MDTLQKVALGIHTLIAILIIVLVLLQRGKGADAGAAFGAGASGTVFGARGSSSFFSRMTAIFATAFFVSSLALAWLSTQHVGAGPRSLLDDAAVEEEVLAPVPVEEPATGDDLPSLEPDPGDELPSLEEAEPEVPDEDVSGE
jgi:preprotein translocase subunit SecG